MLKPPPKSKWQGSCVLSKSIHNKKTNESSKQVHPTSNNEADDRPIETTLRRCRSASIVRPKPLDESIPLAKMNHEVLHKYKKSALASHKRSNPIEYIGISRVYSSRKNKASKSPSTLLETELLERLSQLEIAQLPNKQQARLLVAQDMFDEVILQDRAYSGVLLKIRAEFIKYFESCTNKPQGEDLDAYLLKTENNALKKLSSELQREVDQLRHELLFRPFERPSREVDEADDIPLQLPQSTTDTCNIPSIVPKLNFDALSQFQEDDFD